MENNSNINKDTSENTNISQPDQGDSPQDVRVSLKFRLIVFLQAIVAASCYLYIWYSPISKSSGVISSASNPPLKYPAVLAFVLVFLAVILFIIPALTKKMFFVGSSISSVIQGMVTLAFFLFLCIFILTTLNVTGSFVRIPLIDPIPFLKWVKFLI